MFVVDDLINAGVGIFGKIWSTRMIQKEAEKWLKFWSGQVFTFFISFNVVCGGILCTTGNRYALAIGSGQLVAAARCVWAWESAKKVTEDIVIALPKETLLDASPGFGVTGDATVVLGKDK